MAIVFKGVKIERDWQGKLSGQMTVEGEYGRTWLTLTEDLCAGIVALCADNLVAAAKEIARDMTAEMVAIDKPSATLAARKE